MDGIIKKDVSLKTMMMILLLGGFLSLLNETILNVALPLIMFEMHVTTTMVQWLSTGYVLVVAIMVPISAFFIHTFTTKKLYVGAMSFFGLGTMIAAISPTFTILLTARMFQALGTGLLAPIMIDTALAMYPREKHGYVMGICTCVILVGPSLGPIISGIILQFFTWRALFILLIPLILLCILWGSICLKSVITISHPKIDIKSILFSTIGFSFLVYSMSLISSEYNVIKIITMFALGMLTILLFCKRQLILKEPMLNIKAFIKPYFSLCAGLVIVIQMVQFSMNIVLPILLEKGLLLSPLKAALTLFPAVLICSAITPVSGRIYDSIGGKHLIPTGILVMCIFLFLLSHIHLYTSVFMIATLNMGIYLGIALAWSPMQSHALRQLPLENQAHGVAIVNTFIQLGSSLGTPLFVGLMDKGTQLFFIQNINGFSISSLHTQALYHGFNYSITIASILMGIAFLSSLLLNIEKHIKN